MCGGILCSLEVFELPPLGAGVLNQACHEKQKLQNHLTRIGFLAQVAASVGESNAGRLAWMQIGGQPSNRGFSSKTSSLI